MSRQPNTKALENAYLKFRLQCRKCNSYLHTSFDDEAGYVCKSCGNNAMSLDEEFPSWWRVTFRCDLPDSVTPCYYVYDSSASNAEQCALVKLEHDKKGKTSQFTRAHVERVTVREASDLGLVEPI